MKYDNIKKAIFLSRPNRFIANIDIDGEIYICHVKNTGRCRELLIPGAIIFVKDHYERYNSGNRSTRFDLIGVYKGNRLVNIDSQAPNKVFAEWIMSNNFFENIRLVRPEMTFGNSRFDFYIETCNNRKIFIEVKGVTLEENSVALFPDAPTERGLKHIKELRSCLTQGFEAYIVFVIQMKDITCFKPNYKTHRLFGEMLKEASSSGVKILAVDCHVNQDEITIGDIVDIILDNPIK